MSLTMMKKKAYLALLIALALLLSGCTLKSVDPVADAAQVILNVNGEKVTKAQMTTLINNYTNNLLNTDMNALYYYYYYGRLPYSNTELLDQTITAVTRSMVQEQEAVKQNYNMLLAMLLGFGILLALALLTVLFFHVLESDTLYIVLMTLVLLLVCGGSALLLNRCGDKTYPGIE